MCVYSLPLIDVSPFRYAPSSVSECVIIIIVLNFTQPHNDLASSWTERSVSPGSAVVSGASRPQTPAFPVHPRTPYVNNASPTVTFASDRTYMTSNNSYNVSNNNNNEASGNNNNNVGNYGAERTIYIEERREASKETGLPPKSPTTQR